MKSGCWRCPSWGWCREERSRRGASQCRALGVGGLGGVRSESGGQGGCRTGVGGTELGARVGRLCCVSPRHCGAPESLPLSVQLLDICAAVRCKMSLWLDSSSCHRFFFGLTFNSSLLHPASPPALRIPKGRPRCQFPLFSNISLDPTICCGSGWKLPCSTLLKQGLRLF